MITPKEIPAVRPANGSGAPQRRRQTPYPEGAPALRPARLVRALLIITGLLVLAHLGAHLLALRWDTTVTRVLLIEFDVDKEHNIPTFFSTILLLLSALLLAAISIKKRRAPYARHWSLLPVVFFLLALDEGASMHEYLINPLRVALGATGLLYYTWVVPGALFAVVFAACYLQFLSHLPARTRRLFVLAGVLFVGGAIGFELLEGQYFYHYGVREDFLYSLLTALEEALEMTGVIVFIYALLDYLRQLPGPLQLRIEKEA